MVSKRGMILGMVILVSLILGVLIFSYNSMVRQQNIRAHHELIGEVAGMLAMTGVGLFAEKIDSSVNSIIMTMAPVLLSSVPTTSTISVGSSHPTCDQVRKDFDLLLGQLSHLTDNSVIPARTPRCVSMDVSFESIRQISPSTNSDQFRAGRDPVEKVGEIVISCTVEHRGVGRKAQMRRQFRVVSLVPGPFCRFSLFVPFTPWPYSYNSLGVKYNGKPDPTYTHPFPTPQNFTNPLKIYNGTASFATTGTANDRQDLQNRGWIFLGPSREPSTGTVMLRLPSGFDPDTGGHFLFCLPPNIVSGKETVRPERIEDTVNFNIPVPPAVASFMIGGLFQGFFTFDPGLPAPNQQKGAAGFKFPSGLYLWNGLVLNPSIPWAQSDRWLCASSWLYPFGDRGNPSRTLMIGPVLAGFLKLYFVKSIPPNWKFNFQAIDAPQYNPASMVDGNMGMKYKELFRIPDDTAANAGYTSYTRVMPCNLDVKPSAYPPTAGIAFNVLFDFMKYPPIGSGYPALDEGSPALGAFTNPFFVPNAAEMRAPSSGIPGLHPFEDVKILFTESGGSDPAVSPDNCYFSGNLLNFRFTSENLLGRVTHHLNLGECTSQIEENSQLKDFLFRPAVAADNAPSGPNWLVPKRSGIFYIKRRSGASTGGERLKLPGKIFLTRDLTIIVEMGDLEIPDRIESKKVGDAPEHLCSLVVLDGSLFLGTTDEIDAYLVALNPGPGGGKGGGKLLSSSPSPGSVRRMNIFGGLAIWEMGLYQNSPERTTMTDFTDAGLIQFNPRFNPSSELYPNSRTFIMEEKASQLIVTGAE